MEFVHCLANARRLHIAESSNTNCGQHVLQVVCPFESDIGNEHDFLLPVAIAKQNAGITNICPLLDLFLTAKPEDLRMSSLCQPHARGIVGIENHEVVGPLIFEDARLGICINRESSVAVEMIGSDIEHYCNPRAKVLDRFQLKTGNL